MASEKTQVIEYLFAQRYDPDSGTLTDPLVTRPDVFAAIEATGAKLETGNQANFFKDIVRNEKRNEWFPESVVEQGYTAEQAVGRTEDGLMRVFNFIPLPDGLEAAFPSKVPDPALVEHPHPIQSLSLSVPSRRLGRRDESWLTQVCVRLNVLNTHLALFSKLDLAALDVLQIGVKLGRGEVDAAFLGALGEKDDLIDILVSAEMKSRREVLEEEQVLRGAASLRSSARRALGDDTLEVIPVGVKVIGDGLLWVIEYSTEFPPLEAVNEAVYRLTPLVPGIR